jgi:hypothetical protein
LGDIDIDERIILKWMLKKEALKVWSDQVACWFSPVMELPVA